MAVDAQPGGSLRLENQVDMTTQLEDFGMIGDGETSRWCRDPELPAILHRHRLRERPWRLGGRQKADHHVEDTGDDRSQGNSR
jgi:hypothetical protein